MLSRITNSTQYLLNVFFSKSYTNIDVIVHENQSYSKNLDNGIIYPIQNITFRFLTEDGKLSQSIELFDINLAPLNLFQSLNENFDIHFHFEKNQKITSLPKEMNNNLIKFLKLGRPNKPDYCCINFSYEILYGRGVIKNDNSPESFNGYTFQEEIVKPGTMVYIYRTLESNGSRIHVNQHFAVCIGENYYLSIHGVKGCFAITNLDSMKKYCQGNECLEVREVPELKNTYQCGIQPRTANSLEWKRESSTNGSAKNNFSFFAIAGGIICGSVAIGAVISKTLSKT